VILIFQALYGFKQTNKAFQRKIPTMSNFIEKIGQKFAYSESIAERLGMSKSTGMVVCPYPENAGPYGCDVSVCCFDEVSNYASDKNNIDKDGNPFVFVSSENAKTIEVLTEYLTKKDPETSQYVIATGTKVWVTAGPTLQHRQDVVKSATKIRSDLEYNALHPYDDITLFMKSVQHLCKPKTILINLGVSTTNFVGICQHENEYFLDASTKDTEEMKSSISKIIEVVGTVKNVILAGSMAFVPLWMGVPCHESWMTLMPLKHFMNAVDNLFQEHNGSAENRCFPEAIQESIMCMLEAMSEKVKNVYISARPSKPGVKPPFEELGKIIEPNGVPCKPIFLYNLGVY